VWVTVVALQILLNDKYKLNHCKEMGAEPGRRFLKQPATKLEPESLPLECVTIFQSLSILYESFYCPQNITLMRVLIEIHVFMFQ